MGVMMAPVAGSGSCPAWMQRVGKRASGVSFTAAIVPVYSRGAAATGLDMIRPDRATSAVIHVLPTRSPPRREPRPRGGASRRPAPPPLFRPATGDAPEPGLIALRRLLLHRWPGRAL